MRIFAPLGLLGLLATAGCDGAEPSTATLELALGADRYGIEVPQGAAVTSAEGADRVRLEMHPGRRVPRTIVIGPEVEAGASFPEEASLGEAGRVHYEVERAAGGSGGEEAVLTGEIELSGRRYQLSCHTQGELSEPDATWCLERLATLRPR